jgi:hypothetical protein
MRTLLLIPVLFVCQTSTSEEVSKIYAIKQKGVLIEKRYVDDKNRTTCIVTYDIETKNPIDSISLNYMNQEELAIKAYSLVEGKYEVNELPIISDFYRRIYSADDSLCDILLIVKHKLLIEDVLSNICGIQSSVLPDGKNVSSLAITTKSSDLIEIKYVDVKAMFNNFSETLQSYFYNQIMEGFSLHVKNGYLQKEEYTFIGGVFTRTFFYDAGRLIKSVIDVKYKNGRTKSLTRVYELEKVKSP